MESLSTATDIADIRGEVTELIKSIGTHMRLRFVSCVAEVGLTPPQAMALLQLSEPISMGNLADELVLDASYITGIADQLEERGLIERRPDPGDRRRKILALTQEGQRVHSGLTGELDVARSPAMDALTDRELIQLRDLLVKVMQALDSESR